MHKKRTNTLPNEKSTSWQLWFLKREDSETILQWNYQTTSLREKKKFCFFYNYSGIIDTALYKALQKICFLNLISFFQAFGMISCFWVSNKFEKLFFLHNTRLQRVFVIFFTPLYFSLQNRFYRITGISYTTLHETSKHEHFNDLFVFSILIILVHSFKTEDSRFFRKSQRTGYDGSCCLGFMNIQKKNQYLNE